MAWSVRQSGNSLTAANGTLHEKYILSIKCSKYRLWWLEYMKKNGEMIVLLLFCMGVIAGLLLPRWIFVNVKPEAGFLTMASFQQYATMQVDIRQTWETVSASRLTMMFLLYFACYCAAGFWILIGTALAMGISMGFLGAMSVMQMGYWGILFWACGLMPQWLLYGWAGKLMVQFMERRRARTILCNGNAVPSYNRKVFLEFLKILGITVLGIISEVYLNAVLLKYFLHVYLARK